MFTQQNPPAFTGPDVAWFSLSPLLVLVGTALFLLVAGALTPRWPRGLYAGVSLQGAVVSTRDEWNRSYYARAVTPADILIRGDVKDANAGPLIAAVEKAASMP